MFQSCYNRVGLIRAWARLGWPKFLPLPHWLIFLSFSLPLANLYLDNQDCNCGGGGSGGDNGGGGVERREWGIESRAAQV